MYALQWEAMQNNRGNSFFPKMAYFISEGYIGEQLKECSGENSRTFKQYIRSPMLLERGSLTPSRILWITE